MKILDIYHREVETVFSFLRRNPQYFAVLFIFLLAGFYHYSVIPPEISTDNKIAKVAVEVPDFDAKKTEKIYSNVLQSQSGDFLRVGLVARTRTAEQLEVFLRSPLDGLSKVGELTLQPSDDGKYSEVVFPTSGRYEDVILRLKNDEDTTNAKWNGSAVYVQNFFVTRVNVKDEWEAKHLAPTVFSAGAKLEDLGRGLRYSFSLQGTPVDYVNIFDKSEGVRFDREKKRVTGLQKNGEFLIYKFDTVYPYEKFVVSALQSGNDEKEVKLEYSFDGAFWQEISFAQAKKKPQKFDLTLKGDGKQRFVYVRSSYNGEEKKSGFFGLESLTVDASVPKVK
jgi:hypothetical protein